MTRDPQQFALDFFRVKQRPVFVGELACAMNLGLADTSDLVLKLVSDGKLRAANDGERRRHDIEHNAAAFVLV